MRLPSLSASLGAVRMIIAAVAMFWLAQGKPVFPLALLDLAVDLACLCPCAHCVEVLWAGVASVVCQVSFVGPSSL